MAAPLHIILSKNQPLSKSKKGRNRTLVCWFQANRIKPLMLLSYEMLVNQLHSLVKPKSQVKTLYISHGQPLTIRLPRRLIPYHRGTRWIPRPRSNGCTGNLQLSPLLTSTHTHRKTLFKYCWCTRSRINLNNPASHCTHPTCPTVPTNSLYNGRNRRTRPNSKSHRTSMILKLWIYRLQGPIIRLVHNPDSRTSTRALPTSRSRPPCCSSYRIPDSHYRHCQRCTSLLSRPNPRSKNRCNPWATKPNIIHYNPARDLLRSVLRNLRS